MLEVRLLTGDRQIPFYKLPQLVAPDVAVREIGETIDALIELLDRIAGDCDLEEDDPAGGDICDVPHDPEEDACEAGDDGCGPVWRHGLKHWGARQQ